MTMFIRYTLICVSKASLQSRNCQDCVGLWIVHTCLYLLLEYVYTRRAGCAHLWSLVDHACVEVVPYIMSIILVILLVVGRQRLRMSWD